MLHPHRSLQDLVDGELSDRRRVVVERHVHDCAACSAVVARLRALKSELLGLRRPAPDAAFQRRLLSAAVSAEGAPRREHGVPGSSGAHSARDHRERTPAHPRRRALVAAAGGTAVVVSVILGSAYVVGSETRPVVPDASSGTGALQAGWESVAPLTPTYLDTTQLETLRAGGWYCPELESLGFVLKSAEGITVAGSPTLELVLENDGETVTVYEQRKVGSVTASAPVSAVTGRSVSMDGFEHVGAVDRDLWVRPGKPWQVVLDSPTVTYTVMSSMPAAAMPRTVSQLVATEHAQLALAPRAEDDSMMDRIHRGLSRITQPGGSSR
ncbi:hypothetical protein FJV46_04300 [Arthrobacter agilis]|uniref:zf-HC2 domain-containing protein n=1 Tax=Arthrobacter agilis TaxID=37921 RepID=UPI000B3568B6|nr:zf-HC2 domain-containing protein [Arthrobacter agilis]OUM41377.1 hypothetical protein B8W74_10740 [Arthrobacter agilis]PPB46291.1 hypothetical protein CI784_08150 [Arthrobacter agilis]TPV27048.1 hypothetical protein FJV46_04300 [Arthrobacter agilis]VDR32802.1 Predicted transmembrane transcriptional regulator (anti-sigma factor) [Arthrobacter agilis]